MPFTISETTFGSLSALAIEGDGMRALVTRRGATLIEWAVDGVELVDGYVDEQEFADQAGMRSAIMAPFSNRIRSGRYAFEGRQIDFHDEAPEQSRGTVLHGLLRTVDFEVAVETTGESSATVRFETTALRPGAFPGYPFSVDVAVEMTFHSLGIDVVIEATNVGDTVAPFASGWHPYFRIGDARLDDLVVRVPAATRVVPDADLIPLDGSAAFAPVVGSFDLREAQAINGTKLDVAYLDLEFGADGRAHTTLTDPDSGRSIDAWQESGLMHVFTADGVTRPRTSLAMESVEVMTNALNRPDQAKAIRLEPRQHRAFRFGITTTLETQ